MGICIYNKIYLFELNVFLKKYGRIATVNDDRPSIRLNIDNNGKTKKKKKRKKNLLCSLRKGVPGAQKNWNRCRQTLRHESLEESVHRPEKEDDRAHQDGETSSGGRSGQSFFSYIALCLSNGRKVTSDFR